LRFWEKKIGAEIWYLGTDGCVSLTDGVSWPADFTNATQFYPEKTEQKSRRIPKPKAGQLTRGWAAFYHLL